MVQAVCWMLVHSLWQGWLFTILTGGVLLSTRRSPAVVRYRILCGLLFSFLAVSGLTFFYEWQMAKGGIPFDWKGSASLSGQPLLLPLLDRIGRACSEHASGIVLGWFIFFSARSVRMIAGWTESQRIRHDGITPAPPAWVEKLHSLCQELGISRPVLLIESRLARVPMVMGHLRPLIFIPLGLLNQLPAGEMEAVLLHELAHIRRHDYLVNFLQNITESLFFFNPGLLWMSALLREERENCCDDIAIARTNDRVGFVRALVRFREHELGRERTTLAFPAGRHQLLQRVLRITHQQNKTLSRGEQIFCGVSCLAVAALLFSAQKPLFKRDGDLPVARGSDPSIVASGGGPLLAKEGDSLFERGGSPLIARGGGALSARGDGKTRKRLEEKLHLEKELLIEKENADRMAAREEGYHPGEEGQKRELDNLSKAVRAKMEEDLQRQQDMIRLQQDRVQQETDRAVLFQRLVRIKQEQQYKIKEEEQVKIRLEQQSGMRQQQLDTLRLQAGQ